MTDQILKCRCDQCDLGIEFESEHLREVIRCPKCNSPVILNSNGASRYYVEVNMVSGMTVGVRSVMLYERNKLIALGEKRAQVANLSGGASTGLIPFGSLGWAIGAGMAISAIDAVMTNEALKKAYELSAESTFEEAAIRSGGMFCPVERIENICVPLPSYWHSFPFGAIPNNVNQADAQPPVIPCYIHDGAEFVTVRDLNGKILHLKWGLVESYYGEKQAEKEPENSN